MTESQRHASRCGMIPEDNPPEFFAKHLAAYHYLRPRVTGKKVLELGFGDGYGMNYIAKAASSVVGVDIVAGNIPLASAKYTLPNLSFRHISESGLPFLDYTFDAACSFQVIEHIPEKALYGWLSEIRRVLKPEGLFYVSTLNLANAQKPGRPYEKNIDHEKEFTADELYELLTLVFPKVKMHGLHYTAKHRFFRRLKKWKLDSLPWIRRHFQNTTVREFKVLEKNPETSIDLIAVCGN